MINGGILSIIAIYLIMLVYYGKTAEFYDLLKEQGGFVKWFGALWLLTVIIRLLGGKMGEMARQMTLFALLALALDKGIPALGDINKLLKGE